MDSKLTQKIVLGGTLLLVAGTYFGQKFQNNCYQEENQKKFQPNNSSLNLASIDSLIEKDIASLKEYPMYQGMDTLMIFDSVIGKPYIATQKPTPEEKILYLNKMGYNIPENVNVNDKKKYVLEHRLKDDKLVRM